jgi:hypothetical protein
VGRCLGKRGVRPDAGPASSAADGSARKAAADDSSAVRHKFPYGIDNPRWAARHGFGLPAPSASKSTTPPRRRTAGGPAEHGERARTEEQSRKVTAAVFGTGERELSAPLPGGYTVSVNTDGCLATAQRQLYGDQKRWVRAQVLVDNQRAEAGRRVREDRGYSALESWSRCMAPSQAAKDPAQLRRKWEHRAAGMSAGQGAGTYRRTSGTPSPR